MAVDPFYEETYTVTLGAQERDAVALLRATGGLDTVRLAELLMGDSGPEARQTMRVVLYHARRKLAAVGWTIEPVGRHRRGSKSRPPVYQTYRLARLPPAPAPLIPEHKENKDGVREGLHDQSAVEP